MGMRIEILNQAGQVMPRFTAENCIPMTANKTLHAVRWKGLKNVVPGKPPVQFAFT